MYPTFGFGANTTIAKRKRSGGMDFSPSGQRLLRRLKYDGYCERHKRCCPDGLKSISPPEQHLAYLATLAIKIGSYHSFFNPVTRKISTRS